MIDSEFIIQYTNALYSTPCGFAPRYDEFRDMFSSGQLKSKEWLLNELYDIEHVHRKKIIIAGAWFGTLGMMMKRTFPLNEITMLDIDPRCEQFIGRMIYNKPDMKCVTKDMFNHQYTEDIIINTSCEHIQNLQDWLKLIPKGRIVVLQSNNYDKLPEHVSCVHSTTEFERQTGLSNIKYSGQLLLQNYIRYMVIAET